MFHSMHRRTCPHCGKRYSVAEYYSRVLFRNKDAGWRCSSCNTLLTFDTNRRILLNFIVFFTGPIAGSLLASSRHQLRISYGAVLILAIAFMLLLGLVVYTFDRFKEK